MKSRLAAEVDQSESLRRKAGHEFWTFPKLQFAVFPVLLTVLIGAICSCGNSQKPLATELTAHAATGSANVTGATFNFAPGDPAGEWHSQARDYANTRYSTLDQIDTGNVSKLRIAWTFFTNC